MLERASVASYVSTKHNAEPQTARDAPCGRGRRMIAPPWMPAASR